MDRILTTHVGSLIRPEDLLELQAAQKPGEPPSADYLACLKRSVVDIVDRQIEAGIDVINDGEMGKASWITYLYERITGVEMRPIKVEGSVLPPSRDRQAFPGAYARQDALDEAATRGSDRG